MDLFLIQDKKSIVKTNVYVYCVMSYLSQSLAFYLYFLHLSLYACYQCVDYFAENVLWMKILAKEMFTLGVLKDDHCMFFPIDELLKRST